MRIRHRFLTLIMTLLMAMACAAAVDAESGMAKLADDYTSKTVIIQTSDVHGALDGYSYIAGLEKELRKRHADVVLVDCGDYAQGSVYVSEYKGESAVSLMDMCGYDYAALGNHEFDYGVARMKQNISNRKFVTLCADITDDSIGGLLCAPGDIYPDSGSGGLKIGFVGVATPETQTKALPSRFTGLSFPARDRIYSEVIQEEIDRLRSRGAHVVIALSHLGDLPGSAPYRSYDLLRETKGIDLVLDGHAHSVMEKGAGGEAIMATGTKLVNAGIVVVDNNTRKIVNRFIFGLRDSENSEYYSDLPSDTAVAAAAEGYINEVNDAYGQKIAESKVDLNGEKGTVDGVRGNRTGETNSGDLITDAMLWYVNKEGAVPDTDPAHTVSVINGGAIRAWIRAGDVTREDVRNMLPFENTVVAVYVKGRELLEALEASTYCVPDAVGGFPQVSGIDYTIDESKEYKAAEETYPRSTYHGPASISRVTINSINGRPFDENETYAVLTNDFCAEGGDTYYAFASASRQFDTGMSPEYVLTSYIRNGLNGVIGEQYKEPAGRIHYYNEEDRADPSDDRTSPAVMKDNSLAVKAKTVKLKRSRLRKHAVSVAAGRALKISGGEGSLSFAKIAAGKSRISKKHNKKYGKYFKVDPASGTIKVKKGLKRGSYRLKLRVTAAGDAGHRPASGTVTVKIKVR